MIRSALKAALAGLFLIRSPEPTQDRAMQDLLDNSIRHVDWASDKPTRVSGRNITRPEKIARWKRAGAKAKSRYECLFTKNSLEWRCWMWGFNGGKFVT